MIRTRAYLSARYVGEHTYLILWTPETWREAVRQTGQWASSKEHSFSWWDAAKMGGQIRMQAQGEDCQGLTRLG